MTPLSEYVIGAVNLLPIAYNLWNLPGVTRLRTRLRRQLPPSELSEPTPSVSSTPSVAGVAAELLRTLPPGAIAQYEGPDGSKVTVWWIAAPPAGDSGPEGYALW
ncbi:hypothetical protein ACIBMX_10870 [Streptomyces phaeochromogenes]|uniref:hypothetical protein n=1 Tax=Streptomyces phaeochromogenes TaxID=1923 RepID=UPI0033DC927C